MQRVAAAPTCTHAACVRRQRACTPQAVYAAVQAPPALQRLAPRQRGRNVQHGGSGRWRRAQRQQRRELPIGEERGRMVRLQVSGSHRRAEALAQRCQALQHGLPGLRRLRYLQPRACTPLGMLDAWRQPRSLQPTWPLLSLVHRKRGACMWSTRKDLYRLLTTTPKSVDSRPSYA